MRLIDADALIKRATTYTDDNSGWSCTCQSDGDFVEFVNNEPTVLRWIPCSEKLPIKEKWYLCAVGSPYRNPREMYYAPQMWADGSDHATWRNSDGSYVYDWFVEAWMSLPKPYERREL